MATIHFNLPLREKVQRAFEKNLPDFSHEVLDDCNYYCKEDTGALIASSESSSDFNAGHLVWNAAGKNGYVYAARQCYLIPTAHTTVNPNATWMWPHMAIVTFFPKWMESAQRGIRRYL